MVAEKFGIARVARRIAGGRRHFAKQRRAARHDEDALADSERFERVMGDEQDGAPAQQFGGEFLQAQPGDRIETGAAIKVVGVEGGNLLIVEKI